MSHWVLSHWVLWLWELWHVTGQKVGEMQVKIFYGNKHKIGFQLQENAISQHLDDRITDGLFDSTSTLEAQIVTKRSLLSNIFPVGVAVRFPNRSNAGRLIKAIQTRNFGLVDWEKREVALTIYSAPGPSLFWGTLLFSTNATNSPDDIDILLGNANTPWSEKISILAKILLSNCHCFHRCLRNTPLKWL